jgi:hypothetical protein
MELQRVDKDFLRSCKESYFIKQGLVCTSGTGCVRHGSVIRVTQSRNRGKILHRDAQCIVKSFREYMGYLARE